MILLYLGENDVSVTWLPAEMGCSPWRSSGAGQQHSREEQALLAADVQQEGFLYPRKVPSFLPATLQQPTLPREIHSFRKCLACRCCHLDLPRLLKMDFFLSPGKFSLKQKLSLRCMCTHSDVQGLLLFPWVEKQAGNFNIIFSERDLVPPTSP